MKRVYVDHLNSGFEASVELVVVTIEVLMLKQIGTVKEL
jgi:hypothetical protein